MSIDLTKEQRFQLKSFVKSDVWDLMMKCVYEKIGQLNAERQSGTNAFETLRAIHYRDGKVDGLTEFFSELEKNGFE
jgi:hypothetical protein